MKRAKEWFIKELTGHEIGDYGNYYNSGYEDGLAYAIELAHQLDEPEKVVIPQFVSDWIGHCKENNLDLYEAFGHSDMSGEVSDFIGDMDADEFARAWLDYPNIEVEKEKQYCVIIPTNDLNWKYYYLDNGGGFDMTNDKLDIQSHTEAFIRSVSDELWQFANPVEEEE